MNLEIVFGVLGAVASIAWAAAILRCKHQEVRLLDNIAYELQRASDIHLKLIGVVGDAIQRGWIDR